MARPRAIGLCAAGVLAMAGGAATLLRSSYISIASWRLVVAGGLIGLGALMIWSALRSRR
jgi:hypothetical protein